MVDEGGEGVCGVVCVVVHAEKPTTVCTFETSPLLPPHVYRQHVHMYKTCGRFVGTHGAFLNVHTEWVSSKKTHVELSFAPKVHQVTA